MAHNIQTAGQKITIRAARCAVIDDDIATSLAQEIDAAIAKAVEEATCGLPELLEVAREAAQQPCSSTGLEDMEPGCCKSCRARAALASVKHKEKLAERIVS
jgi:hypothetical protein